MKIHKIATLAGHNAAVYALALTDTHDELLTADGNGWIVSWDLTKPELGKLIARTDVSVFSLLYSNGRLLVGTLSGNVYVIQRGSGEVLKNYAVHRKGVFRIVIHQQHIYSLGGDGCLTKWDAAEMRPAETLQVSANSLRSIDFLEATNEAIIGGSDGSIYIINLATMTVVRQIQQAHKHSVFCLKYLPNYNSVVSGGRDATLRYWDISTWKTIQEVPAHWYTINDIALLANGTKFATASRDKTMKIWNGETGSLEKVINTIKSGGHHRSVNVLMADNH
nr:hypothetical protein [Saprospiraceae bacterium]